MSGERLYRGAVRGFSLVFILLGLAVLIATLAGGGGPASVGFLMGLAFVAVGVGRLYLGAKVGK